jgi:DNA-binding NarL/FixJ family response regulator
MGYLLKDRVADLDALRGRRAARRGGRLAPGPRGRLALLGRRRREDPLEELSRASARCSGSWPRGARNHAIADALVVTERAVEKHVTSIFSKLSLPPTAEDHRRVLAVLTYLRA